MATDTQVSDLQKALFAAAKTILEAVQQDAGGNAARWASVLADVEQEAERLRSAITEAMAVVSDLETRVGTLVGEAQAQARAQLDAATQRLQAAQKAAEHVVDEGTSLLTGDQFLDRLLEIVGQPDWLSVTVAALAATVERAGEPKLSVFVQHATADPAFGRGVGLRYALPSDGVKPHGVMVVLALEGEHPGIRITSQGEGDHEILSAPVKLVVNGVGTITIPVSGSVRRTGHVTVTLDYHLELPEPEVAPAISVRLGALDVHASASAGSEPDGLDWDLQLRMPKEGDQPAAAATLDLTAVLGDTLTSILGVSKVGPGYSPTLTMGRDMDPRLELNEAWA